MHSCSNKGAICDSNTMVDLISEEGRRKGEGGSGRRENNRREDMGEETGEGMGKALRNVGKGTFL